MTKVDKDIYTLTLKERIINYKKDETNVSKEEIYVVTNHLTKQPRKKTMVWKLLVQSKDKYNSWIRLKDMK